MFLHVLRFEWRYFTRQPSLYVTALLFFFVPFLVIAINEFTMGGANLLKNGAFNVTMVQAIFGFLSMFLSVNFVADTALRDHGSKMAALIYCKPINAIHYQVGRLCGSMLVVIFVTSLVPLGLLAGSLMPWVTPERIGPVRLDFYIAGYVFFIVPTAITFSLIFYGLAVRFRSMMAVYLAAVALFIFYEITGDLASTPAARQWAALLDPFAVSTLFNVTRYWTVFEQNTQALELRGVLLYNRLLWLAIGGIVFLACGGLKTKLMAESRAKKSKRADRQNEDAAPPDAVPLALAAYNKGTQDSSLTQLLARCRFEIRQTIFSRSFIILSILLVFVLISVLTQPYRGGNAHLWPFTQNMIEAILGILSFLIPIIITYYVAEIVWRDRQEGIADIIGATPVSNVVLWSAKLIAVCMIIVVLLTMCAGAAIGYQAALGHYRFEIGLYVISLLYFGALPWMMMAVLALLLQVISPNKYMGMFLFVLFIVSNMLLDAMGFTSTLYRFGRSPDLIYSDMNGFGYVLRTHTWYMLYWGALATLFGVLSYGLWHRGPSRALAPRVNEVMQRVGLTGKGIATAAVLLFLTSGATIFFRPSIQTRPNG